MSEDGLLAHYASSARYEFRTMSGGGRVEQPQHATEGSRRNRNDAEVDRRRRVDNVGSTSSTGRRSRQTRPRLKPSVEGQASWAERARGSRTAPVGCRNCPSGDTGARPHAAGVAPQHDRRRAAAVEQHRACRCPDRGTDPGSGPACSCRPGRRTARPWSLAYAIAVRRRARAAVVELAGVAGRQQPDAC